MVQRVGFFVILVCASITNPMFDLADITWFPFGPFFGATLFGKATFSFLSDLFLEQRYLGKPHSETVCDHNLQQAHSGADGVSDWCYPRAGRLSTEALQGVLGGPEGQDARERGPQPTNWLLWVFEKVIVVMVCFFVCSIVNSTAQSYAKRQQQQKYNEGKSK